MTKRGSHAGKSKGDRDSYVKSIRQLKSDSTVNKFVSADSTDEGGESTQRPYNDRRRPQPFREKISKHFHENWVIWLFSAVISLLGLFAFKLNREVGVIGQKIEGLEKDGDKIEESVKNLDAKFDRRYENQQDVLQQLDKNIQVLDARLNMRPVPSNNPK